VELENGTFILPLPGGPLRFLHKIYRGCSDAEIAELQGMSAIRLPDDYIEFMRWAGGVTLFDNTLNIYGLRDNRARSLALEDQGPLSLPMKLLLLQQMGRWNDAAEWQPVGSIAAATQTFSLELSAHGKARLRSEDEAVREFPTFTICLLSLVILFSNASDERGLIDDKCEQLQENLLALFTRH
jgi:hypothetical protein